MDMQTDRIADLLPEKRFHFFEGDITINREWIEYHIKKCDTVLPLVAIATPATYVREPLRVFELDFEANLPIVRACVRHSKRVVFPSTSEVYGMCRDAEFDPKPPSSCSGPINKPRWIYACAKQLMDRVIHAYGMQEGLDYTLFRPFNWIGAGLDSINTAKEGSSRVITQFLGHIVRGEPIKLVDGGTQKRAFTYIDDGIDALLKIIANDGGIASGKIYNIGNPANNYSVRELARDDARPGADLSRIPRQRGEGRARRDDGRRVLRQAATRTCRTACRRSTTPAPTSTGSPRWHGRGAAAHLRRLSRPGCRGARAGRMTPRPLRQSSWRKMPRPAADLMLLALKIDVDTLRGTREGVPRLVEILRRHDAGATFLFSVGPDHTGRAIRRVFRPGFMRKVQRTSVVRHYGIKTLLYGTLLPGPDIGRRAGDVMRRTRDEGFEIGIHAWDHVKWQDGVDGADAEWTGKQMQLACERFTESSRSRRAARRRGLADERARACA